MVTKLNAAGTGLDFSLLLGGERNDWVQDIALDGAGKIYLAGSTQSVNHDEILLTFPVTAGAFSSPNWNDHDTYQAFLSMISANGSGSARAVFTYQGNSGTAAPVGGTTYAANATFGNGAQIGTSG